MDNQNQRGIAIIIAMFAAILVMLAGKSCTSNNSSDNSKSSKSVSYSEKSAGSIQTATNNSGGGVYEYTVTAESQSTGTKIEYVTDMLGRVIGTVEATSGEVSEPETQIEYVTDILGRVLDTVIVTVEPTTQTTEPQIEYVTDILGRVIGTVAPENDHTEDQEASEDNTAPTQPKNPLEEYWEKSSQNAENGNDDEHYTVPSTIHITIG